MNPTMLVVTKTIDDYDHNVMRVLKCFSNDENGKEKAEVFVCKQKENDLYEFKMHKKIEEFTINFKNNHEISKFGSLSALYDPKTQEAKERKNSFTKLCKQYTQEYNIALKEFKKNSGVEEDKHFSSLSVDYYTYDIEVVEVG